MRGERDAHAVFHHRLPLLGATQSDDMLPALLPKRQRTLCAEQGRTSESVCKVRGIGTPSSITGCPFLSRYARPSALPRFAHRLSKGVEVCRTGPHWRERVRGEGNWHAIIHDRLSLLVTLHHAFCVAVVCRDQPSAPKLVRGVCQPLRSMPAQQMTSAIKTLLWLACCCAASCHPHRRGLP